MEEEYYTPIIDEFVEGFEYEVAHDQSFSVLDFNNDKTSTEPEWTRIWFKRTVPNLDPIEYPYTIEKEDGTKWTFMNNGLDEDPLEQVKRLLDNGYIRAKR